MKTRQRMVLILLLHNDINCMEGSTSRCQEMAVDIIFIDIQIRGFQSRYSKVLFCEWHVQYLVHSTGRGYREEL